MKALIEYITVAGLKDTKRREGTAHYWNKTGYNSYLQLNFAMGPLPILAASETKLFGFISERNYSGKIDYVETELRIRFVFRFVSLMQSHGISLNRCSKMVKKVQMDTFKINKFDGKQKFKIPK